MTAFVAWALAESGDRSSNLDRALNYLRTNPGELSNMYAKALAANAFLARDRNDSFGCELATAIKNAAIADHNDTVHWKSDGYSITYSHGSGMTMECTALSVMALMKVGNWPQSVKQGLSWLSSNKFADGTLGSTQATILGMRALLAGNETSLGQDFDSTISVVLNGKKIETIQVTKENSDVVKLLDLTKSLRAGENRIELKQTPTGELPFQLAGAYWLPSVFTPETNRIAPEALEISVQYDRTTLPVDERLNCRVKTINKTDRPINMAILDLGIPPGFDVETTTFAEMQRNNLIEKFEMTGNQIVLYLRELSAGKPFEFAYTVRAKYPLRAQAPASAVYEYYQPQNRGESKPIIIEALPN